MTDSIEILEEYRRGGPRPTLTHPMSQPCTAGQTEEYAFKYWCGVLGLRPFYNRKVWEFCYILQVLSTYGVIAPGFSGLGFGVGREPIASLLAARGCRVLATDLDVSRAAEAGWVASEEHARNRAELFRSDIVGAEEFDALVEFAYCDMNQIPQDYVDFDFCWSSCAFEHLGGIDQGLDFVLNSIRTLKPGGVAVHTTEFNCSSNTDTIDTGGTVLFRKADLERLVSALRADGHQIDVTYYVGDTELDDYIDAPPYRDDHHLKLALGSFLTTSMGLVVRKAGGSPRPGAAGSTSARGRLWPLSRLFPFSGR